MTESKDGIVEVPVKLFIGRFPRDLADSELLSVFETFGKVKECTILRDHETKESKGCGFVRFANLNNAIDCIRELNGKKVLDSSVGPLQVQFANGEVERLALSTDQVEPPPVKIFVGSLPLKFTASDLHHLFNAHGDVVETFVLTDPDTGLSKGSGFVKMRTKSEAANAINALNKHRVSEDGSVLEARLAVSRLQRQRTKSKQTIAPIVQPLRCPITNTVPKVGPVGCNVFVFHLPPEWTEFHLRQLFSIYGFLVSATVVRDKTCQHSKGFGFVSYDNPYSAQAAVVHMNGFMAGSKRLKVQLKRGEGADFALFAGG
jgi:RNA recognition motif-containing protein